MASVNKTNISKVILVEFLAGKEYISESDRVMELSSGKTKNYLEEDQRSVKFDEDIILKLFIDIAYGFNRECKIDRHLEINSMCFNNSDHETIEWLMSKFLSNHSIYECVFSTTGVKKDITDFSPVRCNVNYYFRLFSFQFAGSNIVYIDCPYKKYAKHLKEHIYSPVDRPRGKSDSVLYKNGLRNIRDLREWKDNSERGDAGIRNKLSVFLNSAMSQVVFSGRVIRCMDPNSIDSLSMIRI